MDCKRLLAVGPIKDNAPLSQAINIRSFCHLVTIAPQCGPQIINCYKKNIEPILAKSSNPTKKTKLTKANNRVALISFEKIVPVVQF
ncbi:MAG: hypothetical protein CM1200mP29_01000 [Verrucomicrobiota bacterium]|nr:MAG: hypothetical protein CM1200mP29_01000 [Verrucomicrobiota bacterium]